MRKPSEMDRWRNAETPEELIQPPRQCEPAIDEPAATGELRGFMDILIGFACMAGALVVITLLYRLLRGAILP